MEVNTSMSFRFTTSILGRDSARSIAEMAVKSCSKRVLAMHL